jgi:hypothetical protein
MTNQQINQQNFDNSATAEIPPSQRVYAFKDLPPEVQENLLRLQNSDGDFLRVRYVSTYTSGALLFFLSIGFILFLADFAAFLDVENVVFGLKWIIVFAGGALIFALCYLYLFWRFFSGRRAPIKKGIYLTPTQVIETFDGTVRFRELKDTSEISVDKYQGGWRTSLDVKFADGDFYKYLLYMNRYDEPFALQIPRQLADAKKWQEKVGLWRDEAISAARRGDAAYFDSLDVIQKSATANSPVLGKYFSLRLLMRLMFIITMAMIAFVLIIFLVLKISSE